MVVAIGVLLSDLARVSYLFDVPRYWSPLVALVRMEIARNPMYLLTLLLTSLFAPIAEELFYRATVYAYARQEGGVAFAMVFSSLVFPAVHMEPVRFYDHFWFGIITATQYEVTRRLFPSIATHCVVNVIGVTRTLLR